MHEAHRVEPTLTLPQRVVEEERILASGCYAETSLVEDVA
jgi:hypothetical protein